jgi:hypothetical protein
MAIPSFLQHFVCAKCEKPFLGHRHYEKKGLAYCETHYNQVSLGQILQRHRAGAGEGVGHSGSGDSLAGAMSRHLHVQKWCFGGLLEKILGMAMGSAVLSLGDSPHILKSTARCFLGSLDLCSLLSCEWESVVCTRSQACVLRPWVPAWSLEACM